MATKFKKPQVRLPALGVRLGPEARLMLTTIAERWSTSQREVLEVAIRKVYRSVFSKSQDL